GGTKAFGPATFVASARINAETAETAEKRLDQEERLTMKTRRHEEDTTRRRSMLTSLVARGSWLVARGSWLGTRDSGLGTRDSGLGTRDSDRPTCGARCRSALWHVEPWIAAGPAEAGP